MYSIQNCAINSLDTSETGNYIQSNMSTIMTPIAPNPNQPITPTQILPTQTVIRTTDGQMLIPIQTSMTPTQQPQPIQVGPPKQTVQGMC